MNTLRRHFMVRWNELFHKAEIASKLIEAHYKEGEVNAVYEFPGVAILASEIAGFFDKSGGVNWVETTLMDRATLRMFVVTIQRKGGETPAQKIARLEAEVKRLKSEATE